MLNLHVNIHVIENRHEQNENTAAPVWITFDDTCAQWHKQNRYVDWLDCSFRNQDGVLEREEQRGKAEQESKKKKK